MEYYAHCPAQGNRIDLSSPQTGSRAQRPASAHSRFPAVFPPPAELAEETARIRGVLRRCGVPRADQADLTQEVLIAAWLRIALGQYRPDPAADPKVALRAWLLRIAYFKAEKHRSSARVRRELLAGLDPRDAVPEPAVDALAFLEARDELAMVQHLGFASRHTVLDVAAGYSLSEIGEALGKPAWIVAEWFERGRELLAEITEREGTR